MSERAVFGSVVMLVAVGVAVVAVISGSQPRSAVASDAGVPITPAPEISSASSWINSAPLSLKDLKGQVSIVHFWTFDCINCQRNLAAYNGWQRDLAGQGVKIVGIHTPEFDHEAVLDNVRSHVKKHGIQYPVAVDSNKAIWRTWQNRYWPSIYLVDKRGNVRFRWDGELAYSGATGDATIRAKVKELLAEGA